MQDVILIATRRILRPPKKGSAVQRPRTRTLTAVHDAILEDVVYPAEIVGKRIRYRLDGSKIDKVITSFFLVIKTYLRIVKDCDLIPSLFLLDFLGPKGKKQHRVQAGDVFRCLQEDYRERCGVRISK